MKLSNLILSTGVDDKIQFDISVMLVASNEEKHLASGKWWEPQIKQWADADLLYVEMDLVNNQVSVVI